MCRAIFLQHSFHNIVFSSFLFFFFLSLFFSYQARFPQSRRLFRLVTSNSRSDLHFDSGGWPSWFPDIPPPLLLVCLFARSRSYLKRSFRRKPWTLRAFRVKSWTDLRINYSAHVSPGCALVCRVRTKYLSLSLSSRDSHISEDTNFISLSLSHIRSFLIFVASFHEHVLLVRLLARNEIRCDTRRYHSSFELPLSKGEIFIAAIRARILWRNFEQLRSDRIYHNWTTIE